MKAVMIGAGRIGCGFAGQLLRKAGYELTVVARNPVLVEHFNRVGRYHVRLVQDAEAHEELVDGVRAVCTTEPAQVTQAIASADLIGVSVGAHNLSAVAPLITQGLRQSRTPVNVLAFENLADAGPQLRGLVARSLPAHFPLDDYGFASALVSRVVTERLGDPTGSGPLTYVGDPPDTFVVEGAGLRRSLPPMPGLIVADDYPAWVQCKLYIYSAGHATAAYLGHLKGYHYIHSAVRDPEIRKAVLAAMAEGQRGLVARYGAAVAGRAADLPAILARFENAALNDPIGRVGRDPGRKLGADDRLVGAARLAVAAGIRPEKLALAAAAALCYSNPADPTTAALQRDLKASGASTVLKRTSGLDANHGLGRYVFEVWSRLAFGWQEGNLLLSLDRLQWTWSRS